MSTHEGYTGGLSPSYTAGSCMTYYASSTEEILFHVSTRMPSTSGTDVSHKVRGRERERTDLPTVFITVMCIKCVCVCVYMSSSYYQCVCVCVCVCVTIN